MEILCRTCLKSSDAHSNIFESFKDEKLISQSLMELAPVKIQKDDGYPCIICDNCLQKLMLAHDFKLMIIESDRKLLQNSSENWERPDLPDEIFLKEGTTEHVEFASCGSNDQHTIGDFLYVNCDSVPIKEEDISENKICYFQVNNLAEILSTWKSPDADTITFQANSADQIPTINLIKSGVVACKKYRRKETKLTILNNPDCKRIMESHLSPEKKLHQRVTCTICKHTYTFRYYCNHHIQVQHGNSPSKCNTNEKLYKCDLCKDSFDCNQEIRKHMLLAHKTSKGYFCDICGKIFTYLQVLKRHVLIHTGDKPYPCQVCGKKFRFKANVATHMIVHTEGRSFACNLCPSSYKFRHNLYKHMKKHEDCL